MLLMMSLHKVCYRAAQKKAAAENAVARETVSAAEPEKDDDTELAAVISAAVAQFVSQDAKVLSFRPSAAAAPKKTMWGRLNRLRNFENGRKNQRSGRSPDAGQNSQGSRCRRRYS